MIDYSIFYRRVIDVDRMDRELPKFDAFISAFNASDRVNEVFKGVKASRKIWMVHPEYQYLPIDLPQDHEVVTPASIDEVAQVNVLLAALGPIKGASLCIDITGFMRHVIVFLIQKIAREGVANVSVLYSEPRAYVQQEQTTFSTKTSGVVRPVRGLGSSFHSSGPEILIIGVGYDDKLISQVATNKDGAVVYPIFAFPSLSPDMYQQSAVRAAASGDVALSPSWVSKRHFAPANDPFSTAAVVSSIVSEVDRSLPNANIYLSPLSTKVQALGFGLWWHHEGSARGAASIILPECLTYSRETTKGIRRLWEFTLEL